jgi:hypothetical protein
VALAFAASTELLIASTSLATPEGPVSALVAGFSVAASAAFALAAFFAFSAFAYDHVLYPEKPAAIPPSMESPPPID